MLLEVSACVGQVQAEYWGGLVARVLPSTTWPSYSHPILSRPSLCCTPTAAQGGQVVCEQGLAERVLASWSASQHLEQQKQQKQKQQQQQQQQQQKAPAPTPAPAPPGLEEMAQGLMVIQVR